MPYNHESARRRVLAVERMFQAGYPLTVKQILQKLDLQYDIKAERKTIYYDIAELTFFMPIEKFNHGCKTYFQLIDMERRMRE